VPNFSVIIAVYNDWGALEDCLRALDRQENAPSFEVIVVDDGSDASVPESVGLSNYRFPLKVLRQGHAGIATARNFGVQNASGSILVFTDADCEMRPDCLSILHAAVLNSPRHSCYQLRLVSDCSTLTGRAEQLRLISIQSQTLQPDGSIRYLNTAGFAIRRACLNSGAQLFDPHARRAEDTLLLANLILRADLPLFVGEAIVQHTIRLSWTECMLKDMRSAWREGPTYDMIAAKGVTVRMDDLARMKMMITMWNSAKQPSIGRMAWLMVISRRAVHRIVRLLYKVVGRFLRRSPSSATVYE